MNNITGEIRLTKTRHPFLKLGKVGRNWRYFDCSENPKGFAVGAYYATKLEAFADGPRYWRENWGWEED